MIELTADEVRTLALARDVLVRKIAATEGHPGNGACRRAHESVVIVMRAGVLNESGQSATVFDGYPDDAWSDEPQHVVKIVTPHDFLEMRARERERHE